MSSEFSHVPIWWPYRLSRSVESALGMQFYAFDNREVL